MLPKNSCFETLSLKKKTSLKKKEKKLIWNPNPCPIGQQKRNPKPLDATFRKAGALMGNRLKPCGDPSLWAVFLCCGYTSRMYLELRRKNRLLFFGGQWGGVKNSHRIQFQFFLKLYELRIAKNAFFCNHQNYLITLASSNLVYFHIGEQNPFLQSPNSWIEAGQHDHNFLLCLMNMIIRNDFPTKPPWIWVNRTYTTVFVTTPSSNFLERFGSLRVSNFETLFIL